MSSTPVKKKSGTVLLLVDVINHFEFPGGDELLRNALPIAPRIARLKKRAAHAGIPVIYVNDNFGQWRSDAERLLDYCIRGEAVGRKFVEQVRPGREDYFVLKPMHSAFYQTPLDTLLKHLGSTTLIMCGVATSSCIISTAHDANMRSLRPIVISDCCAARTRREHAHALENIEGITDSKVMLSSSVRFTNL